MSEENQENKLNIELSEEIAEGIYSNLAIISHSNSEFVIDFVKVMPGMPKAKVKSRILMTPEHAKRLLLALDDNIQKFEAKNGKIKDPYTLLPKVFKDYDSNELDLIYGDQELKNGGAAMTAYAVCQFTQISMGERVRLEKALLRYCELDTFAMVMIHLYWEYKLGIFDEFGIEEDYENEDSEEVVLV